MTGFTVVACLAYLGFLIHERLRNSAARRALAHVIHVNGIRGKSSICRLIDAGLRAGGFAVFTKTTGTCPTTIQVDGCEHPIRRKGLPSIKEQLQILRQAARQKADVLVIECMAVLPEYQEISEESMLRSDIGVISNVRLDHCEEMGATLDEIAAALSNTIPRHGTLFTADAAYADYFSAAAAKKGSAHHESGIAAAEFSSIDFAENVAVALAVCHHLGVPQAVALEGMKTYRQDPGAFSVENLTGDNGCSLLFLNALAANDPGSAGMILDLAEEKGLLASGEKILLVNNRHDRPARVQQFIDFALKHEHRFDRFIATGSCRSLTRRALVKGGIAADRITLLGSFSRLAEQKENAVVFAVGNIVGSGKEQRNRFNESTHVG
jgi:poly-gamma-glutamate synthase PgsB/CapB